ncbi:MAG: hypothetical protein KBH14_08980 [Vicinamibacteria bacterium]|nr:hypothetical protein [Vicinamibacteria bacterium]
MPFTRLFRLSIAGLCGVALLVASHGDWTPDTPRFLTAWVVLVVLYGAVLFAAGVFRGASPGLPEVDLKWALVVLVLVRVVIAWSEPLLSDDVYRSVWEGRVQRASGNPFAWDDRPEAGKWESLRDGYVYPRINHPDYAAIYPPAWQWAMRAVNTISDSVTAVKMFGVVCEVLLWAGLWQLLRARGMPVVRVLIAAASPLALIEISGSGHSEAMGLAALVWAMVALERNRSTWAALALAIAFLSKLVPGLLALPWFRRFRLRDYGLMAVVVVILSAPFVEDTALWSLQKYGDLWRFNETLFALTDAIGGSHRAGVILSMAALVVLGFALARQREPDVVHTGLIMTVALLLLMPNVLPWYALWLLAFVPAAQMTSVAPIPPEVPLTEQLPMSPTAQMPPAMPMPPTMAMPPTAQMPPLAAAALAFTLTAPLAYLVYPAFLAGAPWQLPWSHRAIEYGLPLLVFVVAKWHETEPKRPTHGG